VAPLEKVDLLDPVDPMDPFTIIWLHLRSSGREKVQ